MIIIQCFTLIYGDLPMTHFIVYNAAKRENPVSRIFHFQRPIQSQIDLGFLEHHFFIGRNSMGLGSTPGEARGPKEHRWHGQEV
jgi:hypothetical protein